MTVIKTFEYRPGKGVKIEDIDKEVNDFIRKLAKGGQQDVELKICSAENVVLYVLMWEERLR